MTKKYVNFIIIPEDRSEGVKFRLSTLTVKLIIGIIGITILLIAIMAVFYVRTLSVAMLANELKQENQKLREYNSKVVELEKEIENYRLFFSKVADLAGIDQNLFAGEKGALSGQLMSQPIVEVTYSVGPEEIDTQVVDIPNGLPLGGWISRDFTKEHRGIDIAAKEGTEIKATADGVVKFAGWDETFGNLIILKHKEDFESHYGHNQKNLVRAKQEVKKGEVIALSGNTGRSTAPHLHYEIRKDNKSVNPWNYIGKKKTR